MKEKKISLFVFYFLMLIYLEFSFKIFCVSKIFTFSLLSTILYVLAVSFVLTLFTKLFNPKINKWITIVLTFIICLLFSGEFLFKKIFDVYFSLSTFGLADQALTFWKDFVRYFFKYIYGIIIMFTPFVLVIVFNKNIEREKESTRFFLIILLAIVVSYGAFLASLFIKKDDSYSVYNLYYNINDNSLNMQRFGVIPAAALETRRLIWGFDEKIDEFVIIEKDSNDSKNDEVIEYDYNTLDIDFKALAESETNETLKSMHNYFASDNGTQKNEYTGYYKRKNLILFMAESFNSMAVTKELTPTLYRLTHESFNFENFYTPLILSTLGGEFQELNGMYPDLLNKVWRAGTNYYPYGYANVFKPLGYSTYAYHDNQYNFQSRDVYLKTLGFDNYLGCFNGLEKRINCEQWPESDLEMIEATFDDYINGENPFMTYYATVSGHMTYTFGNAMARKNKQYVEDLPLSEKARAYLATQIELDRALEKLISKLDEAGKLEDTVIALVGDHYPYELDLDTVNEISEYTSGFTRDAKIEINRSNFILWNVNTPQISISKVGSQIDVLPTILNIFGIDYDSRLIIGKDILSGEPGLAMFSDRSWVSDYGKYFASTQEFIPKEGVEISDDYVSLMNKVVSSRILMSKLILENDYYRKVLGG